MAQKVGRDWQQIRSVPDVPADMQLDAALRLARAVRDRQLTGPEARDVFTALGLDRAVVTAERVTR